MECGGRRVLSDSGRLDVLVNQMRFMGTYASIEVLPAWQIVDLRIEHQPFWSDHLTKAQADPNTFATRVRPLIKFSSISGRIDLAGPPVPMRPAKVGC